jgi:hypothetical protein
MHPGFMSKLPAAWFPSVLTAYSPTKTTVAGGQETRTFTVAIYTNVACRKSPNVQMRPANTEYRKGEGDFVREVSEWHVVCKSYCPLITPECQVDIDGSRYDVLGVEHDGNNTVTRLHVSDSKPFTP